MTNRHVLVVDDDASIRGYVHDVLGSHGFAVSMLDSGLEVMDRLNAPNRPSVVLLDLAMPRSSGMDVLGGIRRSGNDVPVIVMSATDHSRTIVRAMRVGATDYLVKPVNEEELISSVQAAVSIPRAQQLRSSSRTESAASSPFGAASSDARMSRIRELAVKVADTDVPVLILGETGVGKEVLAKYIHDQSGRTSGAFIKVNCAALPSELLESELFGYEKGAFTGALRDKPGKFEMAGRGTLLLDEIGEMNPLLQAKLLHVLQDGECYRLGGTKPVKTEARILASTNRCLEEAVAKGAFRQDLFFRLAVVRMEIPPLRARTGDIPGLVDDFMAKYCTRYGRRAPAVPPELMDAFHRYSWPGNVRQLENTVRRFVVLPDVELARAEMARTGSTAGESADPATTSLREKSAHAAEQAERQLVLRTLEEVNWNRKAAAKRLDICYKSLLNKLRKWEVPGRAGTASAERDAESDGIDSEQV